MAQRKLAGLFLVLIATLLVQACTFPTVQSNPAAPPAAQESDGAEGDEAGTDSAGADAATETVEAASVELTKLRVLTLPYITFAPFYIAQEEGYFLDHGLDVEFVVMQQAPEVIPALASGQVDVASGVMSAGMLNTIAQGGRIAIVADKGYINPAGCPNYVMIARRSLVEEGPITAEQLRGRKALITQATWLEYYADKLLAEQGLATSDLESVYLPVSAQAEALEQGALDLIVQSEPWITRFQAAGHMPILKTAEELLPDAQAAIMLYGSKLLDEDPEAGERFMRAYLMGVRQYNEGATDRNVEILAQHIQLEPELLREMCWLPIRADGSINVESVLDFQEWAIGRGYMDTAVELEAFWDARFVEAAAD